MANKRERERERGCERGRYSGVRLRCSGPERNRCSPPESERERESFLLVWCTDRTIRKFAQSEREGDEIQEEEGEGRVLFCTREKRFHLLFNFFPLFFQSAERFCFDSLEIEVHRAIKEISLVLYEECKKNIKLGSVRSSWGSCCSFRNSETQRFYLTVARSREVLITL